MRLFTAKVLVVLAFADFGGGVGLRAADRTITANSISGQFLARERLPISLAEPPPPVETTALGSPAFLLTSRRSGTNLGNLVLEPAPLVVSCERIKAKLLAALGLTDAWRARVELVIDRARSPSDMPQLAAMRGQREWFYELILPKSLPPASFLRALTGALLLEMANRGAGTQSADVPLWWIEGMSAHLQANSLPTLFLQPGTETPGERLSLEGQSGVRRLLRDRAPLTFQELSWPDAVATDDEKALFRACSQLFVEELLRLPDGQASLRNMTFELGHDLNWQTAFLTAFHGHFARLVDVEKWWSVACVDFQNAEVGADASVPEAWRRLQRCLDVPVEVSLVSSRLPSEARITLQDAIATWDAPTTEAALLRVITQLQVQAYRAPVELRPIIDAYRVTLSQYVQDRRVLERKGSKNYDSQLVLLRHSAAKRLDALDVQRDRMRARFAKATERADISAAR